MPHPHRDTGYTLIELLVVLVIVGVLTMAYAAYHSDKNGPAVKGAINTLYGTLADAQSLARGTGTTVTLTPSGTGSQAVLTYTSTATDAPQGQYLFASDTSTARFCMVDLDGSSTAGSAALASLKGDLDSAAVNATPIFGTTAWTQSLFDASKTFRFNSNGTANMDAYVLVVGATNGVAQLSGPVGIILVNASGNMFRYYRASSSSAWVRL